MKAQMPAARPTFASLLLLAISAAAGGCGTGTTALPASDAPGHDAADCQPGTPADGDPGDSGASPGGEPVDGGTLPAGELGPLAACPAGALDGIDDYLDDLDSHPGCSAEPSDVRTLQYTPAEIPGYRCIAKDYAFPQGVTEDTTLPIALLIHGNSETPASWERCVDGQSGTETCAHGEDMLAETLLAKGVRVLAVDMRYDRVCDTGGGPDPCSNNDTGNLARNMDHGWGVPIAQHFIRSAMQAWPDRRFAIVGFSFGVTTARDALRRLQCVDGFNPWPQLHEVVLAAGANHGVSTYDLGYCSTNPTMRGQVTCEMGSRSNFGLTDFLRPLNGPARTWESPCGAPGGAAYGDPAACGGNTVGWTTLVMQDNADGTFKDEFVSQGSSGMKGADNVTVSLDDIDTSAYFFGMYSQDGLGLFKNHYGAVRSAAALRTIVGKITQ